MGNNISKEVLIPRNIQRFKDFWIKGGDLRTRRSRRGPRLIMLVGGVMAYQGDDQ
jgi:hypothetical protein